MTTKVDIFSGFLGAGKTTLIKKLLSEVFEGQKIVLIENEFGEIGIDGGFLKDAGVEITELNSGCICCTLVGDFAKSLAEVKQKFDPERIIIEPSGVGKLSDVMKSVTDLDPSAGFELNGLVTVVNAKKAHKMMKAFGEFFNNQLEFASVIVLSRTQDTNEEEIKMLVEDLQKINPKASIITTPWDDISGDTIVKVMERENNLLDELIAEQKKHTHEHDHEHHHDHDHDHEHEHHHHDHDHEEGHEDCDHEHGICHHDHDHDHEHEHNHDHDHHDHHHADDVFDSWGIETPVKYERAEMESILKTLVDSEAYGDILRAKGMVPATDGTWIYFDMTPGEYELREGAPEYTGRICVIGCDLEEERLKKLFKL
ncbi:MAG: GTP-binding protein [Lachnospiraceae bacterium]|nr:GTP-binding protein [Lachnospiraceae bacterium]